MCMRMCVCVLRLSNLGLLRFFKKKGKAAPANVCMRGNVGALLHVWVHADTFTAHTNTHRCLGHLGVRRFPLRFASQARIECMHICYLSDFT